MKTLLGSFHIIFAFLCIALLPEIQAVNPPPDGGYPGGNTAEGQNALFSLNTGSFNTALGWSSLRTVTSGQLNTGVGAATLALNTGDSNTATGAGALLQNTTGFSNTAYGVLALIVNTSGGQNTAVGIAALGSNTTGFTNTALGFSAGNNVTTANHVIAIGNPGADVTNSCFIGQIRGVTTAHADAVPVYIDSVGQLGTVSSSRRFKREIKPMDKASETILGLKPVTFHYNSDDTKRPEFGLIAEEVAEVNPDLVVRDANGKAYTVRYDAVNAMLLNEFLKEHSRVEKLQSAMAQQGEDLEAAVAQQKKTIEALIARLNEQEARIQKISTEVHLPKSASPMLVEND